MPKRAKRRARPALMCIINDWCAPAREHTVWSLSPSVGRRPIRAVYGTCSSRSCACTKKHWRGWLSAYRKPVCAPFRQRQNKQRIKPMTNVQRSRRQVRLSRALGIALTPKAQRIFEKRPYAPGEHGRTRRRTESITQCVCAKSSVFALSMASLRSSFAPLTRRAPTPPARPVTPC